MVSRSPSLTSALGPMQTSWPRPGSSILNSSREPLSITRVTRNLPRMSWYRGCLGITLIVPVEGQSFFFCPHPYVCIPSHGGLHRTREPYRLSGLQWVPSLLLWQFGELGLEASLSYRWVLSTDFPEGTTGAVILLGTVVPTGLVIHRPVVVDCVLLCKGKPVPKVGDPFLCLSRGAIGEPSAEAAFILEDLCRVDDHAPNRGPHDDLPREGVEGHL